jgi:hypothetical protein
MVVRRRRAIFAADAGGKANSFRQSLLVNYVWRLIEVYEGKNARYDLACPIVYAERSSLRSKARKRSGRGDAETKTPGFISRSWSTTRSTAFPSDRAIGKKGPFHWNGQGDGQIWDDRPAPQRSMRVKRSGGRGLSPYGPPVLPSAAHKAGGNTVFGRRGPGRLWVRPCGGLPTPAWRWRRSRRQGRAAASGQ